MDIREHFRRVTKKLQVQAEIAISADHPGIIGEIRENVIENFLEPHMPSQFDIRSGKIIDSDGNMSTQQDILICDRNLPIIDVGGGNTAIFLAESVVAQIEVKSNLNSTKLIEALKSSARTGMLKRDSQQVYSKAAIDINIKKALPIFRYVIAFDGINFESIAKKIEEYIASESLMAEALPDAMCIIGKGVIFRSPLYPNISPATEDNGNHHITMPHSSEAEINFEVLKQDALLRFVQKIVEDVVHTKMTGWNIDRYYQGSLE